MEKGRAFELCGKYYDEITKLGDYPLSKNVTAKELKINKTKTSSCYREMRKLDFKENVVDFLCYLCAEQVMHGWQRYFINQVKYEKIIFPDGIPEDDTFYLQKQHLLKMIEGYEGNRGLWRNAIRIFRRDMSYAYRTEAFAFFTSTFDKDSLKRFHFLPKYMVFKVINIISFLEDHFEKQEDDFIIIKEKLILELQNDYKFI